MDIRKPAARGHVSEQRDPQTYAIIGAVMEVYNQIGGGFLEAVYQEALGIECELREIPCQREVLIPVHYKDRLLTTHYRADLVCFGEVVVELKAIEQITNIERAQLIHYLKATNMKRGLLINFGPQAFTFERLVNQL